MTIQFKLTDRAISLQETKGFVFTPSRSTSGSAGYDLCACIDEDRVFYPDEVALIGTGIHIHIKDRTLVGLLFARSSTKGLMLANSVGVIDSDYLGEIKCKYRNVTGESLTLKAGEKFAQLLVVPCYIDNFKLLTKEDFDTNYSTRGTGGFGSTGV